MKHMVYNYLKKIKRKFYCIIMVDYRFELKSFPQAMV